MKIEIIRHGETELMAQHKYQGSTDVPLSEEGKKKLLPAEAQPERVYVSKMLRAQQTAEIIFPGAQLIVVPGIEEFDFGDFEGRSYMEMENDADYRAWVDSGCTTQCPNGESRALLEARVCPAVLELINRVMAEGRNSITIVAHGGTQMAVGEILVRDDTRDYWAWGLKAAEGWVFEVEDLSLDRPLKVVEKTRYTK